VLVMVGTLLVMAFSKEKKLAPMPIRMMILRRQVLCDKSISMH
jgi:hypothetical protein